VAHPSGIAQFAGPTAAEVLRAAAGWAAQHKGDIGTLVHLQVMSSASGEEWAGYLFHTTLPGDRPAKTP
jgi:hypothetical protein